MAVHILIFQMGFSFLLPFQTGRLVAEMRGVFFFVCLKKACPLLQVVLLPECQAVELLKGHAENLLEVLRR